MSTLTRVLSIFATMFPKVYVKRTIISSFPGYLSNTFINILYISLYSMILSQQHWFVEIILENMAKLVSSPQIFLIIFISINIICLLFKKY